MTSLPQPASVFGSSLGLMCLVISGLSGQDLIKTAESPEWNAGCVHASPNGKRIAVGCLDGKVRVWDPAMKFESVVYENATGVTVSVVISPKGDLLAAGNLDGTIRIVDLENKGRGVTIPAHKDTVWSVAFSPDGKQLASGSADGTVRLFNVTSARDGVITKELSTLKAPSIVMSVGFDKEGTKLVAGTGNGRILVWETAVAKEIRSYSASKGSMVRQVTFSGDGKTLLSGDDDGVVMKWDYELSKEVSRSKYPVAILAASFDPSGEIIATASGDGILRVLASSTMKSIRELKVAELRSIAFAGNGTSLVVGGRTVMTLELKGFTKR